MHRRSAMWWALVVTGVLYRTALPSAQATLPPAQATGVISGVVVNERQQPVARALVQAFANPPADREARQGVPFSGRAASTSTDAEGRFRIEGLRPGDFLVAAHATASVIPDLRSTTAIYATTFYPSTADDRAAVPVSTASGSPVRLELVRVPGVRVAGIAVNRSGRPTGGMQVRLFRGFGGHATEAVLASVNEAGAFEVNRVPPGWYRLTIGWPRVPLEGPGDLASRLIEVRDANIDGLVLDVAPGATITGRVVPEPGAGIPSLLGMRIAAIQPENDYSRSSYATTVVALDGSFRMTGLNGSYTFQARADRAPNVAATSVMVDGAFVSVDTPVEFADGNHEVVVSVARVNSLALLIPHSRLSRPHRCWRGSQPRRCSIGSSSSRRRSRRGATRARCRPSSPG